MTKTPPLYSKHQVITAVRIKKSEWSKNRHSGIIPNPVGREGDSDRWQSTVILECVGKRHPKTPNSFTEKMPSLSGMYPAGWVWVRMATLAN